MNNKSFKTRNRILQKSMIIEEEHGLVIPMKQNHSSKLY